MIVHGLKAFYRDCGESGTASRVPDYARFRCFRGSRHRTLMRFLPMERVEGHSNPTLAGRRADLRLAVVPRAGREALAGVEGAVETDPLDVVEGNGGGAVGPVADGQVEMAVAEDFVLADEVAHAGA